MSATPAAGVQATTEATAQAATPTTPPDTSQADETETLIPTELRAALSEGTVRVRASSFD